MTDTNTHIHTFFFYVHESVHRESMSITVQQDATFTFYYISGNYSTCFGWYHHPSSGAHITVTTASGTGRTVSAIFRCRGGAVTIPRQRKVADTF